MDTTWYQVTGSLHPAGLPGVSHDVNEQVLAGDALAAIKKALIVVADRLNIGPAEWDGKPSVTGAPAATVRLWQSYRGVR